MPNTVLETLSLPGQKTEVAISIGNGLFGSDLPKACLRTKRKAAIIADVNVASLAKKLQDKIHAELFLFDGGEAAKTRKTKEQFEDLLLERGFGRDTLLIGLGGGVVTDFTTFLASTYMRGVSLILVPTSLLAMVDAAIGGKSAVDTPFGKNLIGSTYHPSHIFIDPDLLATLPEPEWTCGLAEILKYGLIADSAIWDLLEENPTDWKSSLHSLLLSSIKAKLKIVAVDPLETKGSRRVLNFGHTIAHALETLSGYTLPHGEAVAIGCVAESALSYRLGYLSHSDFARIRSLFKKFPFSFAVPKDLANLIDAMRIDKKAKGGEPRFVLIDRIGSPVPFEGEYCRPVPTQELQTLIEDTLCLNG